MKGGEFSGSVVVAGVLLFMPLTTSLGSGGALVTSRVGLFRKENGGRKGKKERGTVYAMMDASLLQSYAIAWHLEPMFRFTSYHASLTVHLPFAKGKAATVGIIAHAMPKKMRMLMGRTMPAWC